MEANDTTIPSWELFKAICIIEGMIARCKETGQFAEEDRFRYLSEIRKDVWDECFKKGLVSDEDHRFVKNDEGIFELIDDLTIEDKLTRLRGMILPESATGKLIVPSVMVMRGHEIYELLKSEKPNLELHYTIYETKNRERMLAFKIYGLDGAAFRDGEVFEISLDGGKSWRQALLLLHTFRSKGKLGIDTDSDFVKALRQGGYEVPDDIEIFKNRLSSMVSDLDEKLKDYRSLRAVFYSYVMRSLMVDKEVMDDLLNTSGMGELPTLGKGRRDFSFISIEDYDVVLNLPFSHYEKIGGLSNL